ncbi:MAG TPA: T9SS type A sorting domain-containing protein [Candidatus Syntrophosphaera sp.]|nr:T9SS type A sorting domain-containing protein [Candidatus Syntrophosphaera sp.]
MKKPFLMLALVFSVISAYGLIGYGESNIFAITEQTLPVELSSFNAAVTAHNYVNLQWTSQSESGLLGYRIYRSLSPELASSVLITPSAIAATNTATTQNYNFEDREVETAHTYNYWLESVEFNDSHFYGPVSVTLENDAVPPLPELTTLRHPYPNPFSNSTKLEVEVKGGETASLAIYNLAGQLVRSHSLPSGSHQLSWDGRDLNGQLCASGIYLIRLKSPSCQKTLKLVLMK